MRISLNWIKEIISLPSDIFDTIADEMTMRVAEVEEVIFQQEQYKHIVIGRIKNISPHQDADTLQLVVVDTGDADCEVVCGAPNISPGQTVALALPGAVINDTVVEETKIRGIQSLGMILSERELSISDDHSGIMVIDDSLELGTPFAKAFGMDDVILNIDNHAITHRPDLWSHRGMARELAAVYGIRPPKELDVSLMEKGELTIEIKDQDLCERYTGAIIENITIEESPEWLKKKLIACGIRPIYNIVDITNYVMLEIGEPMHAFDADKVTDRHIIVRRAEDNEKIVTLDGEKRTLTTSDLVIADPEKPIALAGVMGGKSTEITPSTKTIILEAATFSHVSIRNTRRATGLQSEATNRFEKGLPPEITAAAINRACDLIKELVPQTRITAVVDTDYSSADENKVVLTERNIRRLTGADISVEAACRLLTSLGFASLIEGDIALVKVPYWRKRDTNIEADVIEDVARLYGLDKIEPVMPSLPNDPAYQPSMRILEKQLRNILSGACAHEISTYSFSPQNMLQHFSFTDQDHFEIDNPLDQNMRKMRISLLPGMLAGFIKNIPFFDKLDLYEIGRVYHKAPLDAEDLYSNEKNILSLLTFRKNADTVYFETRSFADLILNSFNISFSLIRNKDVPDTHPERTAVIKAQDNSDLGYIGELSPDLCKKVKISERVGVIEINLDNLLPFAAVPRSAYTPPPVYPSISREFSMIAPEELDFSEIHDVVAPLNPRIKDIFLLSLYKGKPIEDGKKSVSFKVVLIDEKKTMSDEEANGIQELIISECASRLNLELRQE
ncbi:phenylalanine--tRNA ligase subunit beta [Planctomycetota bacterium]